MSETTSDPFGYISAMVANWPQHEMRRLDAEEADKHVYYKSTAALRWIHSVRKFLPDDQWIIDDYHVTRLLRHAAVESGPMGRDAMYFVFEDRSWIYASRAREQTKTGWGCGRD